MQQKMTPAGDHGILADFGPAVAASELHSRAAAIRGRPGVLACIVGQQSIYVMFQGTPQVDWDDAPSLPFNPRLHQMDVDFAGPDLQEFLRHAAISREQFLARLPSIRLTARYLGFRAGFAYLEGWPAEWSMPRRTTSRNLVPRGTFAIAGTMAGFYPTDSPGGWNLLGRTNTWLWDPSAEPPIRIAPGDIVELRPKTLSSFETTQFEPAAPGGDVIAEVVAPGQLTTIVGARDWSRAQYGVPAGGPFDEGAAATANGAVGNDAAAPLLECVLVAPRLRFVNARRVAFRDGDGSLQTFSLLAGEDLNIGRFHGAFRAYLAIEGGIDEMRARYAEAPSVLRAGTLLRAPATRCQPPRDEFEMADRADDTRTSIRIVAGPHEAPPLPDQWEVTPQLNRVGIRLRPIASASFIPPADLPSCGMQFGTLQWHPDGSLVAMGPDHPITGGYLQPATVISADLWKLARLSPGERVRLVAV